MPGCLPNLRDFGSCTRSRSSPLADNVLLMLGESNYACGAAGDVLTEENLRALYGVDLKRITFEHAGKTMQTLVPVIPSSHAEINDAR
jgi:hypothetical protein